MGLSEGVVDKVMKIIFRKAVTEAGEDCLM